MGSDIVHSASPLLFAPASGIRKGAGILAIIGGTAMLLEAASSGAEDLGVSEVIKMNQPSEKWRPSVEYAKTAMESLKQKGSREIRIINGYIKLPIMDRSVTWHMENWLGPIRRFYNSKESNVDYAVIDADDTDAVLEIGISNYEYCLGRLLLQVYVRLIDSRTKQVFGRVRNASQSKGESLSSLLENDAEGMKRLILETGNRLLNKGLADLGLISD